MIPNRGNANESRLKDKIRKFENPPNNLHENIINRSTTSTATTTRAEEAKADVDPVKSVSEYGDDKNSRFGSTFLINRDESQSKRIPNKQCNVKLVSDGNNNQVKESKIPHATSDTVHSFKSSLTAPRQQLRDINTHCCVNGDDIKVTRVVIRHLSPIVKKKSPVTDENNRHIVHKQNNLNDNDFSFIDSSSRSSSVSEDLGPCGDEKVNPRNVQIPKITRINSCNYSQEFSVKTSANQNIYSLDQSENCFVHDGRNATGRHINPGRSEYDQHLRASTNRLSSTNINQSVPEKTVSFREKEKIR